MWSNLSNGSFQLSFVLLISNFFSNFALFNTYCFLFICLYKAANMEYLMAV